MADGGMFIFAFALGLAVSGLVASALGAAANLRAGFYPPFVQRDRILISLLATMLAGPVMLFNAAYDGWRDGNLASLPFVIAVGIAAVWTMALGILVTELAWRAGILVT
ncbi:MAG: hypothetical protein AB3N20_20050 [Rhizobiaceae bacterium]